MKAKLIVVLGKTTKRVVVLHLPAVLGRSRQADVTVAHPLISRRHCEISENNGLLILRDLASLNGTMIGGRRIELAPLLPDEEFTIGPLTFRVLYEYSGDRNRFPLPSSSMKKIRPTPTLARLHRLPWTERRCVTLMKACRASRTTRATPARWRCATSWTLRTRTWTRFFRCAHTSGESTAGFSKWLSLAAAGSR